MKNTYWIFLWALLLLAGCKTPVNLEAFRTNAETATEAGDYAIATEAWKMYFDQFTAENEPEASVYARAAETAYQAGDADQALSWFDKAEQKGYENPSIYLTLAEIYRNQNNIPNELLSLETFKSKSPKENSDVNVRLFNIYYDTKQLEKALEVWNDMPDTEKQTAEGLVRFYDINRKMGNDAVIDSVSIELLKVVPDHVDALEWQAQKNYEIGEERYQREMKQYQARPTTGNYQTLLRGLKAASADFRVALQYFEKLWEVNPDSRGQYAVYMNNIHIRFNDKDKANYYKKFIQ